MNPVIGLRIQERSYTGANMAGFVSDLLHEDGIQDKLGYNMGDNATKND
jgi:hypothetical protein